MKYGKISRLPVSPRPREHAVELVHFDPQAPCSHKRVTYRLREGEAEVECGGCGMRLDPMFVLRMLALEDSLWSERRAASIKEAKERETRRRTLCQHCGQMTRINNL